MPVELLVLMCLGFTGLGICIGALFFLRRPSPKPPTPVTEVSAETSDEDLARWVKDLRESSEE